MNQAKWIGIPESEIERCHILQGDMTGRFVYFQHQFYMEEIERLIINISANSRYRLYVNGTSACTGPRKGNLTRMYYETVDITDHLKVGDNLISVQVLYQDTAHGINGDDERAAICGVITPALGHRLFVSSTTAGSEVGQEVDKKNGSVKAADEAANICVTTGVADWKCALEDAYYLTSQPETRIMGAISEHFAVDEVIADWRERYHEEWAKAVSMETVMPDPIATGFGILPRFPLRERDIPLLYEKEDTFQRELTTTGIFEAFKRKNGKSKKKQSAADTLELQAEQPWEIILDAGYVKNTYPVFVIPAGKGSVEITYFEKFVRDGEDLVRDDISGEIRGYSDVIQMGAKEFEYRPFWVRTFRFLRIRITTVEKTCFSFHMPEFKRIGYPLEVNAHIKSSEPWVEKLFDMCVHTLEGCMLETYMDCPFYEQLQYGMDTRLQMLLTYALSGDTRMAKAALEDFHDSISNDGLVGGRAPSAYPQIITTFSLYYIFALWEYYQQTKDMVTLKRYRSDLDRILDYYDSKIGENGLVGWMEYWQFVDWQKEWHDRFGVPFSKEDGASTVINLMYAYALSIAAKISTATGRSALAKEYVERQASILKNVDKLCWNPNEGLYREAPGLDTYSLHAQTWAVLNGKIEKQEAASLMRRACAKEDIIPISFATSYEFFRANEMAGTYDLIRGQLKKWMHLIDLHCGTCPEEPENGRSECHAWSALPIYEMIRVWAGIKPLDSDWNQVSITPNLEHVRELEGNIDTPKGRIRFCFIKLPNGQIQTDYCLPKGMNE